MGSASKQYVKAIHNRFSYLAAWLPNANLRLGDVGIQQGDGFKQMTTLKNLGIPFRVRKGANTVDFTYTSESGVKIRTKLAGEVAAGAVLPLGEAGISLQFSNEGAFLFQAIGCITDEIEDKATLGEAVIAMARAGIWESGWAVVDTLVRAGSATIVVSNSPSAALDLTAKVPVVAANLADLDAGLSVTSQSGDIIRFIAAKGLCPLFTLARLKQSILSKFLGDSSAITFGGVGTDDAISLPPEENVFEAVVPE